MGIVPTEMELILEQTKQGLSHEVSIHTLAGNPVKEILLKLNLPDHRLIITDSQMEVKCLRTRNSYFSNNPSVTIQRRRNKRCAPNVVEPELRTIVEVAPMADNRTMEELLQAPTEGYGEAIVISEINADHFESKTNLLQLVQANPYHGFERENPHTYINNFKRITSTLKFKDVPNDVIKLMMFSYSLEGAARVWYDKEPPNSILTWDDLEMHRACPHHGFMKLTQIDTFYNGLNENDQDSLNAATGGNLLSKTTREALNITNNKPKVCYSRNKPNVYRMNTNSRENASKTDDRIDKLADQISTLVDIFDKKVVTPAMVKAVEESCVTCGGPHAYYNCDAINSNQSSVCAATGFQNQPFQVSNNQVQQGFSNEFSSYKKANDQMMRNMQNQINSFKGEFKNEIQNTMKTQQTILVNEKNAFQNNLQNMFSGFFQNQALTLGTLSSNTISNPKGEMKAVTTRSGVAYEGPSIPTNLKKIVERETDETTDKEQTNFQGSTTHIQPLLCEKATNQMEKFFQIFQDLHFDISFGDALLLMPKFASTIKILLANKDKLFELAKIPLNENCLAMLLKKLPEKFGDPGKFLIPCDFPGMDVCHALADLGASINLMPLFIWKKLSLPELTPTRMTLELADRSITRPKGVVKDVFVKVGKFHFSTDFIVVDFEADPRVPLILGRSFLRTGRSLIDVYGEEITLRVNDESVTFNLNQTTRYSSTYDDMSVNRIDVIDVAREEYGQEMLGFSKNSSGGNPTSNSEPIISDSSPSLTPFKGSDFILEEIKAYLKDESISPEIDHDDYVKQGEVAKAKSSIEEPPELELKDLPSHLEYAYLEGVDKLPAIIAKDLKDDEKEALLKVLKSHKRAIAWKITDIKSIDPRFCTYKILMEEDYKPVVQSQRRVNSKIHEVIKKEVIKLLDAGMIYPIFDSPWVSPIHCVPKKGGITVVENENNEIIPTRLVTDGFSGYFQFPINPPDQEKTTFTYPYGTFAYRRMPFGLCNASRTFQRAIISDHGTHICNDKFAKVMSKYGVTYCLATAYHPQSSGQVEVLNRGLKRILDRMVGENRASLSEKLEDVLWAFRTAYKTPIGCTPY
uniref:Reverse transcriptase domain-containing protein n=1 Tax=Tanacetum cinerariifolium TaxID=118510 RepID=A0A6L2JR08_TANCI|nr:reverse transcriptase domain-containing protein [Tanacetum cinerariifolium]